MGGIAWLLSCSRSGLVRDYVGFSAQGLSFIRPHTVTMLILCLMPSRKCNNTDIFQEWEIKLDKKAKPTEAWALNSELFGVVGLGLGIRGSKG